MLVITQFSHFGGFEAQFERVILNLAWRGMKQKNGGQFYERSKFVMFVYGYREVLSDYNSPISSGN